MSLQSGTRLGPYEIKAPLGAGGMGEVYRARDERLDRDVAIKVLHVGALDDPESRRRFAQEARAVSALNHPNILTVHDIGVADGCPYIVTELIDGESLAALVVRGPVPVRKVLEIAWQVAAGLAAAHDAGIIHRDLKPNNIMLRHDGSVKILDFGIAKMTGVSAAPAEKGETSPGMIVGTASYMSPEQARGEPLDFRSDQFSLGLTLYRLLTGKPAFDRSSTISTMAAIIDEDVPPLDASLPAPVRWIVERCLAKGRDSRYASTHDLHVDLKLVLDRLSEVTAAKPAIAAAAPARRSLRPLIWIAAGMLVAGFAGGLLLSPRPGPDLSGYRMVPLATEAGNKSSPAWAPNGSDIAYSADVAGVRQIFVRGLSSPTPAQVTRAPADCESPLWAADSATVYYRMAGKLWATGAAGGSAEVVQPDVSAAALSPDGKVLAFLRIDSSGKEPLSLWTASPPSASPAKRVFAALQTGVYGEGHLAFSRDNAALGVWLARWGGRSEFWLLPTPAGEPRKAFELQQGASAFTWLPDNRRIAFGGLAPGAATPDLNLADVRSGLVRPLTVTTSSAIEPSASPDGTQLAFTVSQDNSDLVQVPLDGSPMTPMLSTARNELDPSWSPVADEYAYSTDRTGTAQIWLRSRSGEWERPLVTEGNFGQAWITALNETTFSPDGQRIAYAVTGSNGHAICISSTRGGSPLRLAPGEADQRSPSWSPDGAWIAYLESAGGRWTMKKARPGGAGQPVTLLQGCLRAHPKWSKRGDWIAAVTPGGLTLISPEGGAPRTISKDPWLVYGWDHAGSRLYGVKEIADHSYALASIDVDTGVEKIVSSLKLPPHALLSSYSMARDGKSFLTSINHPTADLWLLKGFEKPLPWWRSWGPRAI